MIVFSSRKQSVEVRDERTRVMAGRPPNRRNATFEKNASKEEIFMSSLGI